MYSFSKNIGNETAEHQYLEKVRGYENFVNRYFHDEKYAKRFSSVGTYWEARFHEQMLNPKHGTLDLSKKNYFMLPNFIFMINDYFRLGENGDGSYITKDPNVKATSIDFTGTNLNYQESNQQTSTLNKFSGSSHLYSYLANFLCKNPAIISLNLTNTNITDIGAQQLADALENNTRLLYITLDDNPDINPETLERIDQLLERNRSNVLTFGPRV